MFNHHKNQIESNQLSKIPSNGKLKLNLNSIQTHDDNKYKIYEKPNLVSTSKLNEKKSAEKINKNVEINSLNVSNLRSSSRTTNLQDNNDIKLDGKSKKLKEYKDNYIKREKDMVFDIIVEFLVEIEKILQETLDYNFTSFNITELIELNKTTHLKTKLNSIRSFFTNQVLKNTKNEKKSNQLYDLIEENKKLRDNNNCLIEELDSFRKKVFILEKEIKLRNNNLYQNTSSDNKYNTNAKYDNSIHLLSETQTHNSKIFQSQSQSQSNKDILHRNIKHNENRSLVEDEIKQLKKRIEILEANEVQINRLFDSENSFESTKKKTLKRSYNN